jgi:hypothetical protein
MSKNKGNTVENNFVGIENKISYDEALKLQLPIKKIWICAGKSGNKGDKEEHLRFEELGLVSMDYEYASGLKYPGDFDCKDENQINGCTCALAFDLGK